MPLHQFGISFSNLFIASTRERQRESLFKLFQTCTPTLLALARGFSATTSVLGFFFSCYVSFFTIRTSVHEKALKIRRNSARNTQAMQNCAIQFNRERTTVHDGTIRILLENSSKHRELCLKKHVTKNERTSIQLVLFENQLRNENLCDNKKQPFYKIIRDFHFIILLN